MMLQLGNFVLLAFTVTVYSVEFDSNILCAPKCPLGFFGFETKCYVIPRIKQQWGDAIEFCHTFDSQLLRIESDAEQLFFEKVLHSHPGKDYWIAATDINAEGDWRWCNTYGPVISKWWKPRQPDNRLSRTGHRQHCVALIDREYYKWTDDDCVQHFHFICERQIV